MVFAFFESVFAVCMSLLYMGRCLRWRFSQVHYSDSHGIALGQCQRRKTVKYSIAYFDMRDTKNSNNTNNNVALITASFVDRPISLRNIANNKQAMKINMVNEPPLIFCVLVNPFPC